MNFYKTFKDAVKTYFRNSSLGGLKYLEDTNLTIYERMLWTVFEVIMIVGTIIMIYRLADNFFHNPTITSLERYDYPVQNIKFPGVAICSNNKISKGKVEEMSDEYLKRAVPDIKRKDIMDNIKLFSKFYDVNVDKISTNLLKFYNSYVNILEYNRKYPQELIPYFVVKDLAPSCENLLERCFWENVEYNCSELFQMKTTYEGFCCMFNYISSITNNSTQKLFFKKPRKIRITGLENGLKVWLKNDYENYLYQIIPTLGVKVLLFNPYNYPDAASGEIKEIICAIGAESFIAIEAYTILSVRDVQHFPINIRQCVFEEETSTIFGKYSYSNCLTSCKINSMLALCQCVPFMVPVNETISRCGLENIPCINKYKTKWDTVFPQGKELFDLDHEKEDSLNCQTCYPACSDTSYEIFTNFSPLGSQNNTTNEDMSLIRIYFKHDYSYLYSQDVIYYWYEMLSTFGGLLGILLGGSLITLIEFFYFFFIHLLYILIK